MVLPQTLQCLYLNGLGEPKHVIWCLHDDAPIKPLDGQYKASNGSNEATHELTNFRSETRSRTDTLLKRIT